MAMTTFNKFETKLEVTQKRRHGGRTRFVRAIIHDQFLVVWQNRLMQVFQVSSRNPPETKPIFSDTFSHVHRICAVRVLTDKNNRSHVFLFGHEEVCAFHLPLHGTKVKTIPKIIRRLIEYRHLSHSSSSQSNKKSEYLHQEKKDDKLIEEEEEDHSEEEEEEGIEESYSMNFSAGVLVNISNKGEFIVSYLLDDEGCGELSSTCVVCLNMATNSRKWYDDFIFDDDPSPQVDYFEIPPSHFLFQGDETTEIFDCDTFRGTELVPQFDSDQKDSTKSPGHFHEFLGCQGNSLTKSVFCLLGSEDDESYSIASFDLSGKQLSLDQFEVPKERLLKYFCVENGVFCVMSHNVVYVGRLAQGNMKKKGSIQELVNTQGTLETIISKSVKMAKSGRFVMVGKKVIDSGHHILIPTLVYYDVLSKKKIFQHAQSGAKNYCLSWKVLLSEVGDLVVLYDRFCVKGKHIVKKEGEKNEFEVRDFCEDNGGDGSDGKTIRCVSFTKDYRYLVVFRNDGTLSMYEIPKVIQRNNLLLSDPDLVKEMEEDSMNLLDEKIRVEFLQTCLETFSILHFHSSVVKIPRIFVCL